MFNCQVTAALCIILIVLTVLHLGIRARSARLADSAREALEARQLLEAVEADFDGVGEVDGRPRARYYNRGNSHVVRKYSKLAREKFGLLRDTEANRLMASKWVRTKMVADNAREKDLDGADEVVGVYPYVVESLFIPTRAECNARRLRFSPAVEEAKAKYYAIGRQGLLARLFGWGGSSTAQ